MQKIVLHLLKPSRKYVKDSEEEEETNNIKKTMYMCLFFYSEWSTDSCLATIFSDVVKKPSICRFCTLIELLTVVQSPDMQMPTSPFV